MAQCTTKSSRYRTHIGYTAPESSCAFQIAVPMLHCQLDYERQCTGRA